MGVELSGLIQKYIHPYSFVHVKVSRDFPTLHSDSHPLHLLSPDNSPKIQSSDLRYSHASLSHTHLFIKDQGPKTVQRPPTSGLPRIRKHISNQELCFGLTVSHCRCASVLSIRSCTAMFLPDCLVQQAVTSWYYRIALTYIHVQAHTVGV